MTGGRSTTVRTCPLCEATCGLEVTTEDGVVVRIRGDRDDVFSHGFICPKGSTLKQLQEDPDRLRQPVVKRDGRFVPVSWDEAFAVVAERLPAIIAEHGGNAVATYIGNPTAHNIGAQLYLAPLLRAVGTTNRYSASTVDQMPKQISAGLMFGTGISIPVPDVDRTDYFMVLGANPYASNGSLMTAPDIPGRMEAIQARGGKIVVVDPRRSKSAEMADEHVFIRPGTDSHLLFGIVATLFEEDLVDCGVVAPWVSGLDEMQALARAFAPEVVAPVCGVDAATIRRLARELAAASTAAVYGRIGTCTQEFGTIASWLIDVLNVLTGNLDRPGGAMFTTPVAGGPTTSGTPGKGRGMTLGKFRSRVSGIPGAMGELPVVALAEEILTPGEGQVRAMITIAGNPVLSTPNAAQLDTALASLELMVSVDIYVNETTRHADVILPPPGPLQRPHFDAALYRLAIRNVANWSEPTFPVEDGQLEEWEILCKLALILQGAGPDADVAVIDDVMAKTMARSLDDDEAAAALEARRGPARLVDLMLRTGPFDGMSLDVLLEHPHGVDMGALEPRMPGVLRTRSGMIELAPRELVDDVERLRTATARLADHDTLVLVGRRDLRSNNSWMHNLEVLVKGKPRCTLHVHPEDASRLGLTDGRSAKVASRVHAVEVPVEVTDAVMKGVVSIPHGWGHDLDGVQLDVARRYAGVNMNLLTDDRQFDALSGNAALNGVPVTVAPC
jgi:anaerobic selenocysteine-containing dehydrogenase